MRTFKQYLTEVTTTRREGIVHLEKMKDVDFIRFIQKIRSTMKGKLSDIPIKMKVDGLGARFGKDNNGNIFFEGSRTGPIFEPKSFSNYAKSKGSGPEVIARSYHYDDILEIFQSANFMKVIPNGVKVQCEVMYNPMADETDGGYVFVKTEYDKEKLGSLMTIVPFFVFDANTGNRHEDEQQIIDDLLAQSSNKIRIVNSDLTMTDSIDINTYIKPIESFGEEEIQILQSRKKVDKLRKQELRNVLDRVKKQLSKYILNHSNIVDKFRLGKKFEGIVLTIDGKQYKITTDEFREKLRQEKEARKNG